MSQMQASPLANHVPYTPQTDAILQRLADLRPAKPGGPVPARVVIAPSGVTWRTR
jgi:hypothetical protein